MGKEQMCEALLTGCIILAALAGAGLQRAVAGGRGAAARILTHNILSCDVTKLRTVTTFYDEPHAATLPVVKLIFRLTVSA